MESDASRMDEQILLGIEGGGSRTTALVTNGRRQELDRLALGSSNLKLVSDDQLLAIFRSIAARWSRPAALGIGLAGAWAEADFERIRRLAAIVWPDAPCVATNDLEIALEAAAAGTGAKQLPCVLIVSGTGSGCFAKKNGEGIKVGSWGHVLADSGSGYDIGLRCLRKIVEAHDTTGTWSALGKRILRFLNVTDSNSLIEWAQSADKPKMAALAPEVFASARKGNGDARAIVAAAATALASNADICAGRITRAKAPALFVLTGSILLKQPEFTALLERELMRRRPGSRVGPLPCEGVWGAIELAAQVVGKPPASPPPQARIRTPAKEARLVASSNLSPTEQRNPRSRNLDRMAIADAVRLMFQEEVRGATKLLAHVPEIAKAIRLIVRSLRGGGRLFYVGAGTSGRIGALDASECPPTFSAPPDLVQAIMAGGHRASSDSIEDAEDDHAAGAAAVTEQNVRARDVLVGIAASGTTPFVWGALDQAGRSGATTMLLCFNPHIVLPRGRRPAVVIAVDLGPEVLTGSTRLKAGTATKLVLNAFTTIAMVQLGKVISNLMVDVNPSNAKLRARAIRITRELAGVDESTATNALEASGWVVRTAIERLRTTPTIRTRESGRGNKYK